MEGRKEGRKQGSKELSMFDESKHLIGRNA